MKPAAGAAGVCLAVLSGCGLGGFPSRPPEPEGEPKIWVPDFVSGRLANGLTVHAGHDNYLPLAAIAVGFRGGFLEDPADKAGLGSLLLEELVARTQTLDRLALARASDALGARVATRVTAEGLIVQLEVLEDRVDAALALIAEIVLRPAFTAAEHERRRALHMASFAEQVADPDAAGSMGLRQVVFGRDHPMGRPPTGTPLTLASITLDDVLARHRRTVRPDNMVIAVSGRVVPQQVQQRVATLFGGWLAEGAAAPPPTVGPGPEPAARRTVHYLPRPGLAQTVVYVGSRGLPDRDRNHHLLRIAAARIPTAATRALRHTGGITYEVRALRESNAQAGLYGAHLAVDAAKTGAGVKALVERYDVRPSSSFDFQIEKVVLLTEDARPFFTNAGRVAEIAALFTRGLPVDHWRALHLQLEQERGQNMATVVAEYLRSARQQIVLVGDPTIILEQVAPLGFGAEVLSLPE